MSLGWTRGAVALATISAVAVAAAATTGQADAGTSRDVLGIGGVPPAQSGPYVTGFGAICLNAHAPTAAEAAAGARCQGSDVEVNEFADLARGSPAVAATTLPSCDDLDDAALVASVAQTPDVAENVCE